MVQIVHIYIHINILSNIAGFVQLQDMRVSALIL